jgi:hypothetical protein
VSKTKALIAGTLSIFVFAGIAFATNIDNALRILKGGVTIGATGTALSDSYAASATIDFASTTVGAVDSSSITVTGAAANDVCVVGPPSSLTANAAFSCYVDASNSVKVRFTPLAASVGTITLTSASPSTGTATVLASSVCLCTNQTTQANPVSCSVSSTTLTATGPNTVTDVISYSCRAPVDPASGTYAVRVFDP